jgi:carbamoyl-phosphate synthase small subunit
MHSENVNLALEDDFGALKAVGGEVVFNTGMAGYVETLTDPSYRGQILVLTYPLIGNYGVPSRRKIGSLDPPYESDRIQVQGLVVQHYVDEHSHHAATRSLNEWLLSEDIPAVTGIDTRTLTRRLREHGTMQDDVFRLVAPSEPIHYQGGDLTVLVVDVGVKDNIVRSLLKRGVSVIRAPWHAQLSDLADKVDGIVIGNGPATCRTNSSALGQF